MKAWRIPSFGIENLELVTLPDPEPQRGEVLVRVYAVSWNYRDLMVTVGKYSPKMKLPRIPCSDGAGEVAAVGEGVTRVKVGDRVAGIFMQNWIDGEPDVEKTRGALGGDIDGMLRELVVLREDGVVHFPEHLSYEEAATLPCAGVTAWNALVHAGGVKAGDTVVIQGTGGVSIFALQFAKMMGAQVLGSSSSDEKLERAKTLGLDAGVNYREHPEWDKWVLEQTGGRGADVVIVAASAHGIVEQAVSYTRPGARILLLAQTSHQERVELSGADICVGERMLFGSYSASVDLQKESADLVFGGELPIGELISHRFALNEIRAGIDLALHPGPKSLKIIVQPQRWS